MLSLDTPGSHGRSLSAGQSQAAAFCRSLWAPSAHVLRFLGHWLIFFPVGLRKTNSEKKRVQFPPVELEIPWTLGICTRQALGHQGCHSVSVPGVVKAEVGTPAQEGGV